MSVYVCLSVHMQVSAVLSSPQPLGCASARVGPVNVCLCLYVSVSVCLCLYVSMCVSVFVCVYLCLPVSVCVCPNDRPFSCEKGQSRNWLLFSTNTIPVVCMAIQHSYFGSMVRTCKPQTYLLTYLLTEPLTQLLTHVFTYSPPPWIFGSILLKKVVITWNAFIRLKFGPECVAKVS